MTDGKPPEDSEEPSTQAQPQAPPHKMFFSSDVSPKAIAKALIADYTARKKAAE